MDLKQAIQAQARSLGFVLTGVTTPDPPANYAAFEAWLAAGHQAGMAYLASAQSLSRRAEPRRILPECQSVLVLAAPYYPQSGQEAPAGRGRVAAYAWGEDYHDVLPERLRRLVGFIETQLGHPIASRVYTDTGPLLERDLAQRAGLGWIGKNTCLIHPHLGSYFFLAEVLLGIPLEPDPPFVPDRCGTCTRCLDACPTGCILPGRSLDARHCISYLTIELKGQIDRRERPGLGSWVFGCDICQQVCPWNRFAPPVGDPAFAPHPGMRFPDLQQELALDAEQFNRKFRNSPVRRARRHGYLRNVVVALGNQARVDAIPALERALLADSSALVREQAAWALGRTRGDESRRALDSALRREDDSGVLAEIEAALEMA